eukprot:38428_1
MAEGKKDCGLSCICTEDADTEFDNIVECSFCPEDAKNSLHPECYGLEGVFENMSLSSKWKWECEECRNTRISIYGETLLIRCDKVLVFVTGAKNYTKQNLQNLNFTLVDIRKVVEMCGDMKFDVLTHYSNKDFTKKSARTGCYPDSSLWLTEEGLKLFAKKIKEKFEQEYQKTKVYYDTILWVHSGHGTADGIYDSFGELILISKIKQYFFKEVFGALGLIGSISFTRFADHCQGSQSMNTQIDSSPVPKKYGIVNKSPTKGQKKTEYKKRINQYINDSRNMDEKYLLPKEQALWLLAQKDIQRLGKKTTNNNSIYCHDFVPSETGYSIGSMSFMFQICDVLIDLRKAKVRLFDIGILGPDLFDYKIHSKSKATQFHQLNKQNDNDLIFVVDPNRTSTHTAINITKNAKCKDKKLSKWDWTSYDQPSWINSGKKGISKGKSSAVKHRLRFDNDDPDNKFDNDDNEESEDGIDEDILNEVNKMDGLEFIQIVSNADNYTRICDENLYGYVIDIDTYNKKPKELLFKTERDKKHTELDNITKEIVLSDFYTNGQVRCYPSKGNKQKYDKVSYCQKDSTRKWTVKKNLASGKRTLLIKHKQRMHYSEFYDAYCSKTFKDKAKFSAHCVKDEHIDQIKTYAPQFHKIHSDTLKKHDIKYELIDQFIQQNYITKGGPTTTILSLDLLHTSRKSNILDDIDDESGTISRTRRICNGFVRHFRKSFGSPCNIVLFTAANRETVRDREDKIFQDRIDIIGKLYNDKDLLSKIIFVDSDVLAYQSFKPTGSFCDG